MRPRIASLRLQLEKMPCSRRKLVNLYYPENHILVGLGQISESSALLKKKKKSYCAFCCPSLKRYLYN